MKDQLDANKSIVHDFMEFAFNQKRAEEAVTKFMGPTYKQHNPMAGDGPETFIAYVHQLAEAYPSTRCDIWRQIVEGDVVAQHAHLTRKEGDRGLMVGILQAQGWKAREALGCHPGDS
jgi:predicted SnoaL-like aldol condensation-catalyzing enzyme